METLPKRSFAFKEAKKSHKSVSVTGTIGVGKTTLVKQLSELLGWKAYFEPVSRNPYLKDFYDDKSKYAFSMQVFLLSARFNQQRQITCLGKNCIQDRNIMEDNLFAKMLYDTGLMEPRDYDTYIDLFKTMEASILRPDLIIYLKVSPEVAFERIKQRAREAETNLDFEYTKKLCEEYDLFIKELSSEVPIIQLDWTQYGDVKNVGHIIAKFFEKGKCPKK
jgi:deoxyadenosine kinase